VDQALVRVEHALALVTHALKAAALSPNHEILVERKVAGDLKPLGALTRAREGIAGGSAPAEQLALVVEPLYGSCCCEAEVCSSQGAEAVANGF